MGEENKTTTDLKSSILNRIDEEKVRPCPKLRFVFTNSFFQIASLFSIVIGAVAVAVTIFTSLNVGWEYYEMTHENLTTFIFNIVPYLWIALLLFTVVIGYINVRHTKNGYKYSLPVMLLVMVGTSLAGGVALYAMQVGSQIDNITHSMFPGQYKGAYIAQKEMWQNPERGRLIGVITATGTDDFVLEDMNGDSWTISRAMLKTFDMELAELGREVRLIGLIDHEAKEVLGCVLLPGVSELKADFKDFSQRRAHIKQRLYDESSEENPATTTGPEVTSSDCHDLVTSQLPPRPRPEEMIPNPNPEKLEVIQ